MARLMSKNKRAAANIRIRYLMDQIVEYDTYNCKLADAYIVEMLDEVIYLMEKSRVTIPERKVTNNITKADIETAKDYPVDRLIEFKRGKAHCISGTHADKNPSMFFGHRKNIAVCPACNSKWNSIEIVMQQQGLNFYDAVRSLL